MKVIGFLFIIGLALLIGLYFLITRMIEPTRGKTIINAKYYNEVLTITYDDGSTEQYKGSVTVWHKMPYMQRCSIFTESRLCDIWTYIEHYGNPYPNAHKTKSK